MISIIAAAISPIYIAFIDLPRGNMIRELEVNRNSVMNEENCSDNSENAVVAREARMDSLLHFASERQIQFA